MNEKEEEQKEQQQIKFHREYLCVLLIARPPHRHERKFCGAHVCNATFKHLPQLIYKVSEPEGGILIFL